MLRDFDGAGKIESIEGEWRHGVSYKNILDVMVMLYEPSEEEFEALREIKELSRPDRVYTFDLERKYYLPVQDTNPESMQLSFHLKRFPYPADS